jgi:hypothetical protein
MQERSETWKALAKTGTFLLNSVAVIGGVEYSSTTAPVITRGLFSDAPSVGNCTAANLRLSILTDDDIPKSAEVQIKMRLLEALNGTSSEWLPAGTFYITTRSKDYSSGLLTLECYDGMLKAQQDFFPKGEEIDTAAWPKSMTETVDIIAQRMGVAIDSRTVLRTGDAYQMPRPGRLTLLEVLGYIGGANGGNWIMTPEGKLRLVPLVSPPDDSTADAMDVVAVLSKLTTGQTLTITGVSMTDDTSVNTYSAGDTSGYTLTITGNPYASQAICDDLYATYNGLIYHPFAAEKAIYDPAAELGDPVRYNGLVYSFLAQETATLNTTFRSDILAPINAENEDEYPYVSSQQKTTTALKEALKEAISSVAEEYYLSTSATSLEDGEWVALPPDWTEGHYLWSRTKTTTTTGTVTYGEAKCLSGATGQAGEDATLLRIDSSRGTVFKNNAVSTVLSAVIYHGSQRITDQATLQTVFGRSAYLEWSWQRMDEDRFGVISSSDSRLGENSFTFTLSPDDVDTKVTFQCNLIV